jgi:hypothetical protein
MRPLRLTDSQLHAVRRAAALLRPQARDAFLRLLAHELADLDPIDDGSVEKATSCASTASGLIATR